jgi:hypothetical protein
MNISNRRRLDLSGVPAEVLLGEIHTVQTP